jgi:homoserine O-acetyltransferase/O-succinyltransferase
VNAAVNSAVEHTVSIGALTLDGGETLRDVEQRVTIYGDRAARTVLAPHALTGSSRVLDWWPGIAGEHALFDPREWCIVGINALGSCYGSTGPSTRTNFPRVTVADIVRAQRRALDELGIERLDVVAGGSLGGMQALQWALDAPERVGCAIVIGAHDHHSAMGVALNAVQREALRLDPVSGLRLARKIAMLTYKSEELFNERHDRRTDRHGKPYFDVEGYLELQADRFESRMDAATYAILTHAMDSFDVRGVARREQLQREKAKLCFVGISSDWLFRPEDIRGAAERFSVSGWPSHYLELSSKHGHDAFLAEGRALAELLRSFVTAP